MNRWKIDKYGFVNFWLFDKEEIKTSHGNLLLNGENGSGKSVTLQSFIPLIFDGDLSARNLSTEGDSSRKMDYYLSYGGKKEGISYLYGELSIEDNEGNRSYINLIIGMKSKNGSLISKWYVITKGKRVGEDFSLYRTDGKYIEPYDKQSLKKNLKSKIDGHYEVYEKPQDYKVAVNKEIFGFGEVDEYDETLNLIRKLRKPDLKENGSLDPKKIYEILNSSLKVMPENELRGMSDTLENIEKVSTELEAMRHKLGILKEIRDSYNTYKNIVLAKRLKEYYKAYEESISGRERHKKDIEKKEIKEKKLEKTKEKSKRYVDELETNMRELNELEGSQGNTLISRLVNCKDDIAKLERKIVDLDREIGIEEEKLKELSQKLKVTSKELEKSRSKCIDRVEGLKKMQAEMNLEWEIDYYEEIEERRVDRLESLSKKYDEHKLNIEKLMVLVGTLEVAEKEIVEVDRRLIEERKIVEGYRGKGKELERVNTEEVGNFIDIFNEEYKELVIDYKSVKEFQEVALELVEGYNGKKDVMNLFTKLRDYKQEELSKESMKYERSIEKIQEEIDDKSKEKMSLENSQDSEIELLSYKKLYRDKVKKNNVKTQSFYKCIKFRSGVDETVKGKIERALWEIGVLDALVDSEELYDRYIDGARKIENNLTKYIEVEDHCKEEEKVLRVLESISIEKDSEIYVTKDGEYKNNVIVGRVEESKGLYIGIEERKKQREAKIGILEKEIDDLVERKDLLEESRQNIYERISVLDKEYRGLVGKYKEIFDPIYEQYNEVGILLKNRKNDIYVIEKNLEIKQEKKQKIYKEIEIKEKRLNISLKKEKYTELEGILKNFKQELEVFKTLLEVMISHGKRIDDINQSLASNKDLEDRYREERRSNINKKNELDKTCKSWELEIKSKNLESLSKKISDLRDIINKEIPNKRHINDVAMGKLQGEIEGLKENIEVGKIKVNDLESARNIQEKLLKLEVNQDHKISEGEITDADGKKDLYDRYRKYEDKREQQYVHKITDLLIKNGSALREYRIEKIEYGYEEIEGLVKAQVNGDWASRYIIIGSFRGSKIHLGELYDTLEEMIKVDSEVLTDEEGKFFSEMVFNYLYNEVEGRIKESNRWVKHIDKIMSNAKTNSGKRYILEWKPKDLQFGFTGKKLEEHIENIHNPSSKGENSKEALQVFFKKKIDDMKKRAEDNKEYTSSYEIIKEILDYRKWYEFRMKVVDGVGKSPVELTKRKLNSYSGGEKAMAMYIPLFSALYARFKNASEKAPIILGMDEAFSVVDDENISKLFEILEDLNVNYLLASQKLSGTYHSVKNLAIVHIENIATRRNLPPEDAYVTLIKYIWNGKKKLKDSRDIDGTLEIEGSLF